MAMLPISEEKLNFHKFTEIVMDEFPNAVRQLFVEMWDKKYVSMPWNDSSVLRKLFHNKEGTTQIPTKRSFNEWDCTALFKATIYSKSFSLAIRGGPETLAKHYLNNAPKPNPFHLTVKSIKGDHNETYTFVIDQLRILRNTLCHSFKAGINTKEFKKYVQLAKEAFDAVSLSSERLDAIVSFSQSDFPSEKRLKLDEYVINKFQETQLRRTESRLFEENVERRFDDVEGRFDCVDERLEKILTRVSTGSKGKLK